MKAAQLFDLTGRTALVTGSSRGIGRTLARGLARAGAAVVINARTPDRVEATVSELRAEGLAVHGCPFDVTDAAAVEEAVAGIEAGIGPLDILVNNAGMQLRKPVAEWTLEEWHRVLDANLTAVFLACQVFGRAMVACGSGGSIINISSASSGPPL